MNAPQGDEADARVGALLRSAFITEPLSAGQLARIRPEVAAAWRQSVRRPPARRWRLVAAVALPLLAGLLAFGVLRHDDSAIAATYSIGLPGSLVAGTPGHPLEELRTGAPLRSGTVVEARQDGELRWLQGGVLRLRAGARLRIVDPQHVEMQSGTLYVALAAPHAPDALTVNTPFGTVEHIGTQFLLALRPDSLDIGVREGSVQLRGLQVADVAAGRAVHVDRAGLVARRELAADDPEWSWVGAPLYPFDADGQSVLALLQWAALEKGRALSFDDAEARRRAEQTTLHGSIRDLSVDDALATMLATTTLTARLGDDALHVHAGPAESPDQR